LKFDAVLICINALMLIHYQEELADLNASTEDAVFWQRNLRPSVSMKSEAVKSAETKTAPAGAV
jgi:hypothetical protein